MRRELMVSAKEAIKSKKRYQVDKIIGFPIDGETIGHAGMSCGFVHLVDENGNIQGYCGINYFKENARLYNDFVEENKCQ